MNKAAWVTGTEGFIGSHMVKFLSARGWKVVGSYLREGPEPFPVLANVRFAHCDLRNGQRVSQLVHQYRPCLLYTSPSPRD